MKKYFYDPHPGLSGCLVRIPKNIKKIAENINGTKCNLEEIINIFKTESASINNSKISIYKDCINLTVNDDSGFPKHIWRVIRFRNKE